MQEPAYCALPTVIVCMPNKSRQLLPGPLMRLLQQFHLAELSSVSTSISAMLTDCRMSMLLLMSGCGIVMGKGIYGKGKKECRRRRSLVVHPDPLTPLHVPNTFSSLSAQPTIVANGTTHYYAPSWITCCNTMKRLTSTPPTLHSLATFRVTNHYALLHSFTPSIGSHPSRPTNHAHHYGLTEPVV